MATASLEVTINADTFGDIVDIAGYGISYWADKAIVTNDNYLVTSIDGESIEITPAKLEKTIADIISGVFKLHEDIRAAALSVATEQDAGEIDANVADVLIQLAGFGELVYA